MAVLELHEYRNLAEQAKKIGGYICSLRALASSQLTTDRIREICNDIYLQTDEFLAKVEKLEQKQKRKEMKNK